MHELFHESIRPSFPLFANLGMTPAEPLQQNLDVSRVTLVRAAKELVAKIISLGRARRTAYAARRPIRGSWKELTVYRIDPDGAAQE